MTSLFYRLKSFYVLSNAKVCYNSINHRKAQGGAKLVNIQIFGKSKCFDTKKAERYFKERRVKFQSIDMRQKGMSRGELLSVKSCVGLEAMIDYSVPDSEILKYLAGDQAREEKLLENPWFIKTPIVRNGKKATVGYCPDVWKDWE